MPRAGLTTGSVVAAGAGLAAAAGGGGGPRARRAARVGGGPPSLYKHVDGLDALFDALALLGLREAHARTQRATAGRAQDDALFALAHAYWRFARERPGLYAATLRGLGSADREIAGANDALLGTVLAVLGGYGIAGDDALHATRGLRAIIHGFVSLDAAGGFRLKLDLDESFDRLLAAFARDLAARGK